MPFLLRVELPDVPGSLGRVASAIGEAGGDIEAIEIVEKRHDANTAVDDILLEIVPGALPDSIVSACNRMDGVRVVWISRYAAGGNLFLDLEAVEEMTGDPAGALDKLVDLLPITFRADWAARMNQSSGIVHATEAVARVTPAGIQPIDRGVAAGGRDGDDVAFVMWTSGTTGRPTAVHHTHTAYVELLDRVLAPLRGGGAATDPRRPTPNLIPCRWR